MAKELDLSGVDEILAQPAEEKELDLSGVDDVLKPTLKDKIMNTEIPMTPFFDPTVGDVVDTGKAIGTPIAETAHDFGVGAAQGLTFGAADEVGGGLAALIDKGLGYIPGTGAHDLKKANEALGIEDDSLADLYRDYQKGSEKEFKAAGERSPIVNTIGDIGGGIVSGIGAGKLLGIGEKAKNAKSVYDIYKDQGKLKAGAELLKRGGINYAKAAPAMAAEAALRSEGNLVNGTDEEQSQVGKDVLGSLAFGLPTMLGLDAVTEVAAPAAKEAFKKGKDAIGNFAEKNPFFRKLGIGFDLGMQGTNPISESGIKKLEGQQLDRSQGLLKNIMDADNKLGQAVGDSLTNADKIGVRLDVNEAINSSQGKKTLEELYKTMDDINQNSSRGRQIFSKIEQTADGMVTPLEAQALMDDVDAFISKLNAIGVDKKTQTDLNSLERLYAIRDSMKKQMKAMIPGYAEANKRFTEFRRLVPETIMSGSIPEETSNIFMGKLRDPEKKLYNSINDLQMNATAQGSGAIDKRKAFINTERGINELMQNQPNSPFNGQQFLDNIKNYSDQANFLKDVQTVKSPFVTSSNVLGAVGQLGHSGALAGSVATGRVAKPVVDLSRRVYKMPAEQLNSLADRLTNTPGLQTLGQALKDGLVNGDQAKKNAALFSILQNPNARILFESEDENEGN